MIKRTLALILALLLCPAFALAEEGGEAIYEGAILVFDAPRDVEIVEFEIGENWYYQALYSEGMDEFLLSGAWPAPEERDSFLSTLLGDTRDAVVNEEVDALQGHLARRYALMVDGGDASRGIASLLSGESAYVLQVFTVDGDWAYFLAACLPLSVYLDSSWAGKETLEIMEAQMASARIFDPMASFTLAREDEIDLQAWEIVGDYIFDYEADAILILAQRPITAVTLSGVDVDESWENIFPGEAIASWDALSFGQAIRLHAYLPDVLPGFALSYTDPEGKEQVRYITTSGLDGSLMLIE